MPFKRIFLRLVIILIVLILGLVLWFILPRGETALTQFIPPEAFAFLSLKIDLTDPGFADLLTHIQGKIQGRNRWLIKYGTPLLLPRGVVLIAIPSSEGENPDYLILVKGDRVVKISRLFRKLIDKSLIKDRPFERIKYKSCHILNLGDLTREEEIHSYTIFRDTILASNRPSLLMASLDQYRKESVSASGDVWADFDRLRKLGEGAFFIDNTQAGFTRAIKDLEERSAYTIFPTANSVKWLSGYCNLLDADSLKGSLIFKYQEARETREGKEDVRFLIGILRRAAKANRLDFTYEMKEDNGRLDLEFRLSGLKPLMANLLVKKEEK